MGLGPMATPGFRGPGCGSGLVAREDDSCVQCRSCGVVPDPEGGVIDFVRENGGGSERAHYDDFYRRAPRPAPPRDISVLASTWVDDDAPWEMRRVWERLGDLEGRTVVLLGNGESFRELYLLA